MIWEQRRIAEMADLVNGFPFESSAFRSSDGIPLVRVRDILREPFETFVPAELVPVSAMIRNGDVVIGMDGDFNVTHWARGPAALNQRVCLLRDNGSSEMRFLAYALPAHLSVVNDLTYATTVKHLSSGQVRAIRLLAPALDEQRVIADYLDRETARIDTLIEEQERLIEMLLERRRSVVEHETGTGGATPPEDWPVQTLRRVGRFITGTTPSGEADDVFDEQGAIIWAKPEDLGGRVTRGRRLSELGVAQVRPARDAVLVCCVGATVGKVGWASGLIASNQQITAIEVEGSAKFWYYALTGSHSTLVALAVGNTIPILNNMRLGDLAVAVPPTVVQIAIAERLDVKLTKIDQLVAETERFIELSRERRAALITAAVTGQIDVREAA